MIPQTPVPPVPETPPPEVIVIDSPPEIQGFGTQDESAIEGRCRTTGDRFAVATSARGPTWRVGGLSK